MNCPACSAKNGPAMGHGKGAVRCVAHEVDTFKVRRQNGAIVTRGTRPRRVRAVFECLCGCAFTLEIDHPTADQAHWLAQQAYEARTGVL